MRRWTGVQPPSMTPHGVWMPWTRMGDGPLPRGTIPAGERATEVGTLSHARQATVQLRDGSPPQRESAAVAARGRLTARARWPITKSYQHAGLATHRHVPVHRPSTRVVPRHAIPLSTASIGSTRSLWDSLLFANRRHTTDYTGQDADDGVAVSHPSATAGGFSAHAELRAGCPLELLRQGRRYFTCCGRARPGSIAPC
jgi:hypothetical protein